MSEIVYKVLNNNRTSPGCPNWLQIEYKVNEWTTPKYPALAFDTLENARLFRKWDLKYGKRDCKIWTARAHGIQPMSYLLRVAGGNDEEARDELESFWRGYEIPYELKLNAPRGTLACEHIMLLDEVPE